MKEPMLAERTKQIEVSPTMKVLAEADRLRRAGVDVVDFGAGEPDFPTPDHVKTAAHDAIDANFTKYTPNAGTSELKRAINRLYRDLYGVEYTEAETIITAGGKQALYNAAVSLFNPGDEVITHAPGWPTIREQIKLAEATPVIVRNHPEDGFRIKGQPLVDAITPRTRGIVINSPCNPTGALISEEDMSLVAREAKARGIWVMLDLCYERLIYDSAAHNLPRRLVEEMRDLAVLTGSASKTYSMTGWRCGWVLAPAAVVAACGALQSHSTSNVCSITQKATVAALEGPQDCVRDMLDEYRRRRDAIHEWLTADPRFRCVKPSGAFYLFVDVSDLLSPAGLRTSSDFAQALLDKEQVAVTPGEAFDAPGFIRISYATSVDRLREGARRILKFAGDLAPVVNVAAARG